MNAGKRRASGLSLALALAALVAGSTATPSRAGQVSFPPGVAVFVDAAEHQAVARAAADLARDLETVLGSPSPLVRERQAIRDRPAIVVTTREHAHQEEAEPFLDGPEAHAAWVQVTDRHPRVILTGADTRGAIYAVYTFSDEILDVPPLWFWAAWQPPRQDRLEIPDDWRRRFPPPHVRWRSAFPNNADFLRGWAATTGANVDEVLFETLLRLKMNTLDVGEALLDHHGRVHPRILAAQARGLAVTSAFLGSFRDWPLGVNRAPRDLRLDNIAGLEEFWSTRVEALARRNIEMIWGIGFRGTSDTGFASAFPDAPKSAALQGQVVTEMLARQLALLRRLTGNPHPIVRTEIYSELSKLFAAGHFRPPADPDLIWHFANEGRDHHPGEDLLTWQPPFHRRLGYYMNLQFTSTGSHYADGEGPWKMALNFQAPEEKVGAPLVITKVNVGNVREFLVSLAVHADLAWIGFDAPTDAVVRRIFVRYFGAAGDEVAALYRALLESYWQQRRPDLTGFDRQFIFHDLRLGQAIARLLTLIERDHFSVAPLDADRFRVSPADNDASTQLEALMKGTERSAALRTQLLEKAKRVRASLTSEKRPLFDDLVTTPATLLLGLDRATAALAAAVSVPPPRVKTASRAGEELRAAATALGQIVELLSVSEREPFLGWYSSLEILDLRDLHARAEKSAARFR